MRNDSITAILGDLRSQQDVDHTLQNLLAALTQNLELRARYRVFEFEARQEGLEDCAALFADLRVASGEQIQTLLAGLQSRLTDVLGPAPALAVSATAHAVHAEAVA